MGHTMLVANRLLPNPQWVLTNSIAILNPVGAGLLTSRVLAVA